MALDIQYPTQAGITRLMAQPNDVRAPSNHSTHIRYDQAAKGFQDLFNTYIERLERLYPKIEQKWEKRLAASQRRGMSREEAIEAGHQRALAGPAAYPEFIALVRAVWLDCDQINQRSAVGDNVGQEYVLLGWLIEADLVDFVELVACMPYWPVGLDKDGNWC